MARRCEICGKGTSAGNNVPRKGQFKAKGGFGTYIGIKTMLESWKGTKGLIYPPFHGKSPAMQGFIFALLLAVGLLWP